MKIFVKTLFIMLFFAINMATAASAGEVKLQIGENLPDLSYLDPNGVKTKFSSHRGKIVVAHYLASWCSPCWEEAPELIKAYNALKGEKGIQWVILGHRESIEYTRDMVKQLKAPYRVGSSGSGDGRYATEIKISDSDDFIQPRGVPFTFMLNAAGKVIFVKYGTVKNERGQIEGGWSRYVQTLKQASQLVLAGEPVTGISPSEHAEGTVVTATSE